MQTPIQLDASRSRRLYDELSFAISRTDSTVLREWRNRSAGRLINLSAHRIGGRASLVSTIGKDAWSELLDIFKAAGKGGAMEHIGNRTSAAIDGSIAIGKAAG